MPSATPESTTLSPVAGGPAAEPAKGTPGTDPQNCPIDPNGNDALPDPGSAPPDTNKQPAQTLQLQDPPAPPRVLQKLVTLKKLEAAEEAKYEHVTPVPATGDCHFQHPLAIVILSRGVCSTASTFAKRLPMQLGSEPTKHFSPLAKILAARPQYHSKNAYKPPPKPHDQPEDLATSTNHAMSANLFKVAVAAFNSKISLSTKSQALAKKVSEGDDFEGSDEYKQSLTAINLERAYLEETHPEMSKWCDKRMGPQKHATASNEHPAFLLIRALLVTKAMDEDYTLDVGLINLVIDEAEKEMLRSHRGEEKVAGKKRDRGAEASHIRLEVVIRTFMKAVEPCWVHELSVQRTAARTYILNNFFVFVVLTSQKIPGFTVKFADPKPPPTAVQTDSATSASSDAIPYANTPPVEDRLGLPKKFGNQQKGSRYISNELGKKNRAIVAAVVDQHPELTVHCDYAEFSLDRRNISSVFRSSNFSEAPKFRKTATVSLIPLALDVLV